MKLNFQGSQKRPIRVTISQKGLGKKFQKLHLFDHQYPKVNGVVTLFTVTNFRPVSTSSTHVGRGQCSGHLGKEVVERKGIRPMASPRARLHLSLTSFP